MASYPEFSIYVVILLGGLLAFVSPYRAFLFASFGLSALNMSAAFFARTAIFGPYLNLVDTFMMVMLMALVMDLLSHHSFRLLVPRPIVWLAVVWVTGVLLGILALGGLRYEVLREARWALNFPLGILVAAHFVIGSRRSATFVKVLFAGAVLAALQHIVLVRNSNWGYLSGLSTPTLLNNVRSIGFMYSPIPYFFVAGTLQQLIGNQNSSRLVRGIWLGGLALFAISLILNQTRSLWIAIMISVFLLSLLVKGVRQLFKSTRILMVVFLILLIIMPLVVPALNPLEIIQSRYETISDSELRFATTLTRRNEIRVEIKLWVDSGPIGWFFGRGFAYRWADSLVALYGATSGEGARVAWGHIGYIAYLANLGLLGFIIYGIYIPLYGIRLSRRPYFMSTDSGVQSLALMALASSVVNPIMFTMSSSYLTPQMVIPGLLLGAVIGNTQRSLFTTQSTKGRRRWKPGLVSQS